jgi:hypothetical protein
LAVAARIAAQAFKRIITASQRIMHRTNGSLSLAAPVGQNLNAAQASRITIFDRARRGRSKETTVAPGIDQILPSAKDYSKKLALAEMEEAAKQARRAAQVAAEKKALLDQLASPSGLSDDEAVRRAITLIERAVSNGLSEIQVYRFTNQLCTDRGRAINQQEPGWEKTLTGVPKEIYDLWERHFRERGYALRAEIVSFPNGMPGDIAITLRWG